MSELLKPCPFCGGEAETHNNGVWEPVIDDGGAYVDITIEDASAFWIECPKCGCLTQGGSTPEEAIAAWNRRADAKEDSREQ
jgi:Lar family restriction alleviation protein